jgi:uncharacterized protein YbjT (DUF2867 family)
MTMRRKVLILGGTGFLGRALCEALVERSGGARQRVVVATRRRAQARAVQLLPTVEVVQADLHQGPQLARLMVGCDAVVNLVAILHGDEAAFRRVHVDLPRRISSDMRAVGVRRLIHVSALGLPVEAGAQAAAPAASMYLRSKLQGEGIVDSAGLDTTILRPSVMYGAEDLLLNRFAALQALLPLVPLAAADARLQPVWVRDVAQAIVRCLDDDGTHDRIYECAGPQVFSLSELVRLAGRLSGRPRPVWPLPPALARLQARFFELLPGPPVISRDNLASLDVPNVASGVLPGLQDLGIAPATLEDVARGYLGQVQGTARLEAWRRVAGR